MISKFTCGSAVVVSALATSVSAQETVAEQESVVISPAPGSQRLKVEDSDGDVDNRNASDMDPNELIKVAVNDKVNIEYLGPRKLVGKRPTYRLTAAIETEKTEDCKTKITRQPYEPDYHDEPTLELGRQLKVIVVRLSASKEVVEERQLRSDGTLDGDPMEVDDNGFVTIRYEYPEKDVCFSTRALNNEEIEKLIQPKLREIAAMPNYKIVGDGYVGDVRPGEIKQARVKLSVLRTR